MGKGLRRDGRENSCVAVTKRGNMGSKGENLERPHVDRSVNMLWLPLHR